MKLADKYEKDYQEFLKKEVGSAMEQEQYFTSLTQYRSEMKKYRQHQRLKKKGLLKVRELH